MHWTDLMGYALALAKAARIFAERDPAEYELPPGAQRAKLTSGSTTAACKT